jgi:serine/threonine protein phosphatase PrpC
MARIVETLLDKLIAPDTSTGLGCDNMTCIIVNLKNVKKSEG